MPDDMKTVQRLVGEITEEQLRNSDYAVTENIGMFMPVVGPCGYAVTPDHTHPSHSFVFAFDNTGLMRLGKTVIRSKEGTFTAVSALVPHAEILQDHIPRYIAVIVRPSLFESVWRSVSEDPIPTFLGETYASNERLGAALKEFLIEYESRPPGYAALLEAEASRICLLIVRQILGVTIPTGHMSSVLSVNRAVELVHRCFADKISVGDMARAAHLSISRFSKVFKEEAGLSPADFIQQVRLDRAKRMLIADTLSLTEIALACGFNSSSYFSYCFSKHFGQSPSDFRKSLA